MPQLHQLAVILLIVVMDLSVPSAIERFRPSLFVLGSQVAAATLNAAARLIETRPEPVHPFQILLVRMLITGVGCTWYLWHTGFSMTNCLLGTPEVGRLIGLRALGGICGATGFFCTSYRRRFTPEPIQSHWIWIFDGYLLVVMLTARVHISLYDILKSQ